MVSNIYGHGGGARQVGQSQGYTAEGQGKALPLPMLRNGTVNFGNAQVEPREQMEQPEEMLPSVGIFQQLLMLIGLQSLLQGPQADVSAKLDGQKGVSETEKDTSVPPTDENLQGRPPGDTRSAQEIIDANPVLKNLGNQKDIKRDELKQRFGDWTEDNPDPASRADAAYNMARVLNSIKGLNNCEGGSRGDLANNGKIDGITKSGDARHGTEAGVLKDIAEQGLKALPSNGNLPQTEDSHVRLDGTNKDNFQWAMGEFGKMLSNIPILKSVLAPMFNNMGEARGLGDVFTGALKGIGEGAMSVARGPVGWAATAATDAVQILIENLKHTK
ncbi:hypothetical protein N5E15_21880 [Pantoea stewartii]|uniref:hypothetical protein n=1 Tax=Pantoea stewartii TaxID=66269 RepID=UPI0021D4CFB2|nr:hypothetical protein [Pantoea stewartii]MCU7369229.1 hypothetical protein [Pantoea stewartii]